MLPTLRAVAVTLAATLIAAAGAAAPASAAEPWTATFAAGDVCTFPLTISGTGGDPAVYRELVDHHGRLHAILSAGEGQELTYTNANNGTTFSTPANGASSFTVYHPNGSQTIRMWGHNVVLMFPTDVGGPSATLYSGLVVIKVSPTGVWRVLSAPATKLDICRRVAG